MSEPFIGSVEWHEMLESIQAACRGAEAAFRPEFVDDKRAHYLSAHFDRAVPDTGGNRRSRRAAAARGRK